MREPAASCCSAICDGDLDLITAATGTGVDGSERLFINRHNGNNH